jgi:ATP-dependent protease ClpP protease subunit
MKAKRELRAAINGGVAELWIYDEIDDWWGISANSVRQAIKGLGEFDELTVHINSPGGMVTEAVAIYNLMRTHSATVNVKVEGLAASAASIIAMAGDNIEVFEGAMFMIHDPWSHTRGNEQDHRSTADILASMGGSMADIYAARTSQTREWALDKMAAETWFSASEAVEVGLADSLVAGKSAAAAKAQGLFDLGRYQFKNAPQARASAAVAVADPQLNLPVVEPEETSEMKAIAKAFGLSENATEGEVLASIHENKAASASKQKQLEADLAAARAEAAEARAQVGAIEEAVGKKGDEAIGAIRAHVKSTERVVELEAKIKQDAEAASAKEREDLIAKGKADGKLTVKEAEFWGAQPVASLKAYLDIASVKVPQGEVKPPKGEGNASGDVTYQGKTYAAMTGVEREALCKANPELWAQMRTDWRASGCPTPSAG